MKPNLHDRICEALNMFSEDFIEGRLGLIEFSYRVERLLGDKTLSDITPDYGLSWLPIVDSGFNLIYLSSLHSIRMTIRDEDKDRGDRRTVAATVRWDDDELEDTATLAHRVSANDNGSDSDPDPDPDPDISDKPKFVELPEFAELPEPAARAAAYVQSLMDASQGPCNDPNCPDCASFKGVKAALDRMASGSGGGVSLIPPGLLIGFGPIKRDEN